MVPVMFPEAVGIRDMGTVQGFIRKTSPAALRTYCDARSITLPNDFDWTRPHPPLGKAFIAAIDKLPEQDRMRLRNDAERLTEMTDERGQAALTNVVKGRIAFDQLDGAHDRAVWAFLNTPIEFGHAEQARLADEQRRKKMWDGWVAMPDLVLKRDAESLAAFKGNIRQTFNSQHVHVDVFDRDQRSTGGVRVPVVQIVIYRDGLPTDDLVFRQQDELVRQSRRPVLEASLIYDSEGGIVEVVASDRETREELVRSMARDLMGFDLKGNRLPFKKYSLDGLLKAHSFPTDAADGIAGVEVRSLRLMPMDDQGERVTLETSAKAQRTIWEMSESRFGKANPLSGEFVCTQARLAISFHPAKPGGRGKIVSLMITMPHSCSLRDQTAREQVIGEKYLKAWNLLVDA